MHPVMLPKIAVSRSVLAADQLFATLLMLVAKCSVQALSCTVGYTSCYVLLLSPDKD